MKKTASRPRRLVRAAFLVAAALPASTAFALEGTEGMSPLAGIGWGVLATVVYGLLGIVLALVGYKAFEIVLPFSVKHELEEDHNMSVGVLLAAMVLGTSIIIAATIAS